MKRLTRIVTCLGMLAGVGLLAAAAFQPATPAKPASATGGPVITIQEVETDSPEDYAMWIAKSNKAIYDAFNIENTTKVFLGQAAGEDSGKVFAVQTGESFSKMAANAQAFEKDPGLLKLRAGMNQVRKLGKQTQYKAVRWDGRADSSAVYNTRAVLSDEAAYLKALDGLRTLFDANNLKDVKINCYRVVAGRTDYTHLISLNCPSIDRRAAMMDALSEPWAQEWIATVGKNRTVISNGTYRELAPTN
jgi:hypothetical protein